MKIELELRQTKGYIDKDVIVLTVEDPKSNVGSGGATINALLTITEYISAKQGYSVSFHVIQLVKKNMIMNEHDELSNITLSSQFKVKG